jgi:nitrite reductase/ring-hydroxylating ferredoxin subunit
MSELEFVSCFGFGISDLKSMLPAPPSGRRSFLANLLALVFAAAALAVPVVSALAAFLNPWRQKASSGKWIRAASLDSLPEGQPQRCPIIADRTDAWNDFPAEAIGAVFLIRGKDKQVLALQSICPHNGGCVSFDTAKSCYLCPSHGARFDVQGRRLGENSVSPRDLDALEVEVRDGGEVWVKYETFRDGVSEKIVKT